MTSRLTPCRQCGQPISRAAATCPQCGIDSPGKGLAARAAETLFKPGTLATIAVLYVAARCAMPAAPPSAEQRAQAARNEAACRQDAHCWGDRHRGSAAFACRRATEQRALHAVRWPGGKTDAFPAWSWYDRAAGTMLYAGEAELQNGFGAWTPYAVICIYDTSTGKALRVEMQEGRL